MNRPQELESALATLERFLPDETARARRALSLILEGIRDSGWPEVAWEFSHLTGDRFPVELSFSSGSPEVRYTCEVDGPERPPEERLVRAVDLLHRLGSSPPDSGLIELLAATQRHGTLRTGAWIAGRHGAEHDRFKIYAEIPDEAERPAAILELLGDDLAPIAAKLGKVRMVGHEPSTDATELYFRSRRLETWQLTRLLAVLQMADRAGELIRMVESLAHRRIGDRLPGTHQGFSLTKTPSGVVLTYLSFARTLAGGDGRIRQRTLELAADLDWNLEAYAELSRSLSRRNDWRTLHGMFAFPVRSSGVGLQIGLRPPGATT